MMRALVTGAAGLLGGHLCHYLTQKGHVVFALDDLSGGRREHLPEGVEFCLGSVGDEKLVNKVFADFAPEYVYHLAAYAAEGLSHYIRAFNYSNNVVGSMNIINSCIRHRIRRLVFTSSIAVYGHAQPPFREDGLVQPSDPYGIGKLAVEYDLRCAYEQFGLEYVIFRPHNVYGPFQNIGDRYRNVIGIFMSQLLRGKSLTIFGDGGQSRAFTYVEDIIPVVAESARAFDMRNETYNLGADQPISVGKLASMVMEAMEREGAVEWLPARNEARHAFADHSKLRRTELGRRFPLTTSLAEGLKRMAEWVNVVGPMDAGPRRDVELTDGLPEVWRAEETTYADLPLPALRPHARTG